MLNSSRMRRMVSVGSAVSEVHAGGHGSSRSNGGLVASARMISRRRAPWGELPACASASQYVEDVQQLEARSVQRFSSLQ